MFERFTDRSRRVLVLAQEEARHLNHGFIGTEHLLLGLIHEGDGIAAQALSELGVSLATARARVEGVAGRGGSGPTGSPPFTPRAKKVLELALREALQLDHHYIGTEHLLLGLVAEGEGVAAQVLVSLVGDLALVRQQIVQILSGYGSEDPVGTGASPAFVAGSNPNARIVNCSFCGRGSPESGLLVSGANAYICEHCIHEWSDRLRQSREPRIRPTVVLDQGELLLAGEPPEDIAAAESGIEAAFAGSSATSEDGRSVPTVEKGQLLGPVLAAARERRRDVAPPGAEVITSVDETVFSDPTHAAVWFSISVDGRTMLSRHRGDAVFIEGVWKVTRSTFCDLMTMARVPCPPDTE